MWRAVLGALCCVGVALAQDDYNRKEWRLWIDADHNCRDTRTEVLMAEADTYQLDRRQCRVVAGVWVDPYSGAVVTNPKQLDVDHLVPLGWAATHGGAAWSPAMKEAYANDLIDRDHLVAVSLKLNRQKGAKGPDRWVPPLVAAHCWYGEAWARVIGKWDLTASEAEWHAIGMLLLSCAHG